MGRRLRDVLALLAMFSDWPSRGRFVWMKIRRRLPGHGRPQSLKIGRLDGFSFLARPETHDLSTLRHAVLESQYEPPEELSGELLRVVELGANVGASVVSLAYHHPEAQLLAVEPDPGNFAILEQNVSAFSDRCTPVRAAVWTHDADLVVEGDSSFGFTVREATTTEPQGARRVAGRTIDSLMDEYFGDQMIDYMHICIEGSEPAVLRAGGDWPRRVRALRVELYPDDFGFTGPECVELLEALGYRAWHTAGTDLHADPYAFGISD